jgi:hypothetical protein
MTDSFPLTAADLRKHASDFHVYEQQLALELGGLSGLVEVRDFVQVRHC